MSSIETINLNRAQLLGSLLLFTRTFYRLRTGRDFVVSNPPLRESHHIIISRQLTRVAMGEVSNLIINCPPRYGKSELCIHFIAWMMARFPDSNFLYISYSLGLAKRQTQAIREIISLPEYEGIFGITIDKESSAKQDFKTNFGGAVYAAGSSGTVVGLGAGIKGAGRFGGCIMIDDFHKPDESDSDVIREGQLDIYRNSIKNRVNDRDTPIVCLAQCTHEADLNFRLMQGLDERKWERLVIPALDDNKNALDPSMHTRDELIKMSELSPYYFALQYQQVAVPAGGGIFQRDWFVLLDEMPKMLCTFITCDTAETDKSWNDATVFSFWGVYKIKDFGHETDKLGLHWIDCLEDRVEPKDLKDRFIRFYGECMRFPVKPHLIAIEKKSTGVTLSSQLQELRGAKVFPIERDISSGNKIRRFRDCQFYVSSGFISLNPDAKHTANCIEHMGKITGTGTHRFDDIADTFADAVRLTYIDKTVLTTSSIASSSREQMLDKMATHLNQQIQTGRQLWHR